MLPNKHKPLETLTYLGRVTGLQREEDNDYEIHSEDANRIIIVVYYAALRLPQP